MAHVKQRNRSLRSCRGNSIIEVVLMAPWLFFLFLAVFDFGYYAYALIATENAARVAAQAAALGPVSAGASSTVCQYALEELRSMPNITAAMNCPASCADGSDCAVAGGPLSAKAESVTGPDGAAATRVSVTYTTIPMFPIPGLMAGQLTLTRTVTMRLKG